MKIEIKTNEPYLEIEVVGRIDATTVTDFESQIIPIAESSNCSILLDLKQVDYISSAGLRAFLKIAKITQKQQLKLACTNLQTATYEVFKISGFNTIIKCFANNEEAITFIKG